MTCNRIPTEFSIQGGTANGSYDTPLMDTAFERIYLSSIRFLDASGAQVTPSAGTVTFLAAPDGVNFQSVQNGSFSAADAYTPGRAMPAGAGAVRRARITLSGVVGADSFYAAVSRY